MNSFPRGLQPMPISLVSGCTQREKWQAQREHTGTIHIESDRARHTARRLKDRNQGWVKTMTIMMAVGLWPMTEQMKRDRYVIGTSSFVIQTGPDPFSTLGTWPGRDRMWFCWNVKERERTLTPVSTSALYTGTPLHCKHCPPVAFEGYNKFQGKPHYTVTTFRF